MGSGIPKVAATWRKGKFLQYCVKSYNINKTKRWEPIWKGAGSESKRYGRREIQTPLSPPPPVCTEYLQHVLIVLLYHLWNKRVLNTSGYVRRIVSNVNQSESDNSRKDYSLTHFITYQVKTWGFPLELLVETHHQP